MTIKFNFDRKAVTIVRADNGDTSIITTYLRVNFPSCGHECNVIIWSNKQF